MARDRIWAHWDRSGWVVMLGVIAAVFSLGYVGLTSYAAAHDVDWTVTTRMYMAMTLFVADNGGATGAVPWTLEVARWLAPLVLATAAVGTAVALVRTRTGEWRAAWYKGHVVVVGLGERGWRAASSAKAQGLRVVAIEQDPSGPHVRRARRHGIAVIVGDGADRGRLRAARVERAARMIVLGGGTATVAGVAGAVADLERDRGPFSPEFCCYVAVDDDSAVQDLNALMSVAGTPVSRELFSLEGRAGPVLIERWGGFVGSAHAPGPIVVVGDTGAAASVVAAAGRQWRARVADGVATGVLDIVWAGVGSRSRLHVPGEAEGSVRVRRLLSADASATAEATDAMSRSRHGRDRPGGVVEQALDALAAPPSLVVVGTINDADALAALTEATARTRQAETRVVALAQRASLVTLVCDHPAIEVFDVLGELCTDEAIARGQLDEMARALHMGYLRQIDRTLTPDARALKPAYRSWDTLPSDLRRQNYQAARAMWEQLRAHGFSVVTTSAAITHVEAFDADVVDQIAQAEHARWFASRHPGEPVPPWDEVLPEHAEQTRDQVRRMPMVLAAADLQIARTS